MGKFWTFDTSQVTISLKCAGRPARLKLKVKEAWTYDNWMPGANVWSYRKTSGYLPFFGLWRKKSDLWQSSFFSFSRYVEEKIRYFKNIFLSFLTRKYAIRKNTTNIPSSYLDQWTIEFVNISILRQQYFGNFKRDAWKYKKKNQYVSVNIYMLLYMRYSLLLFLYGNLNKKVNVSCHGQKLQFLNIFLFSTSQDIFFIRKTCRKKSEKNIESKKYEKKLPIY